MYKRSKLYKSHKVAPHLSSRTRQESESGLNWSGHLFIYSRPPLCQNISYLHEIWKQFHTLHCFHWKCVMTYFLSLHFLHVKKFDQLKDGQYTDNLHLLVYNSDFHFCPSRWEGVAVILSIIYIDDMPNSSTLATVTHANCTKAFVPKKWDTLKCCLLCVHKTANRQLLQNFAKLDSFARKAAEDHPP